MGRRLIQGPVDRTGRHPIRSTILAATAAALATIALVVVASGKPAVAASSLVNGNFETGDLTGWSVDTTASGGTASAVASYDYCYPSIEGCWEQLTMLPQEGSYFALLTSGYQSEGTRISQPFEASNGDKVSGWAFFKTENSMYDPYTGANDDKAQVVITSDSGTTVATPFEQSISSVWYMGNSGWMYWEHTFSGLTGVGQFQIEARVQNPGPFRCGCSFLGLDDVKTSIGGPDTTPPETSITSGLGSSVVTTSTSAEFGFSSNEQGSTFKCQLSKGGAVAQAWADCTSPKSYSNLTSASYTFEVRATDPAGNVDPTPASRTWHIATTPPSDTTAPDTSITSGPSGPTNNTAPTFTFSGSDNVTTTANLKYQYKLDSGGWSTPPSTSTTANPTGLSEGAHLFEVRAVDEAGNVDTSPAQRSFTVDTTAPKVMSTTVPGPDAKGVDPTTNVKATFSEAMLASSINGQTVKLFKKGSTTKIAATVSYPDPDPNSPPYTAKLDPTDSLRSGVTYKAVITTGAKDVAGNPLEQQYGWFFTVG